MMVQLPHSERPPGSVSPVTGAPAPATVGSQGRALSRSVHRLSARLSNVWVPQIAWAVGRTGRAGLAGIALLGASGMFYLFTHRPVLAEVAQLRTDLAEAQARAAHAPAASAGEPARVARELPARTEMPQVLGVLLAQADQAQLTIDTAKYEIGATTKSGAVVRYNMAFPIAGPYPKVRQFIDATLKEIPALAIDSVSITRKSIGDETVEAQVRMTIFARSAP
jgi:hypothetical protein